MSHVQHSPYSGTPNLMGDTALPQGAPVWGRYSPASGSPSLGETQPCLREPQSVRCSCSLEHPI